MAWVSGLLILLIAILCWLLTSLLTMELDTRESRAMVKWGIIGYAIIWYEHRWRFHIQLLFYGKTLNIGELKRKSKNTGSSGAGNKKKRHPNLKSRLKLFLAIIKTFRVTQWKLALDTGDFALNGQLYPLNILPYFANHLLINFQNENYMVLKIRNRPWRIIYAFLKNQFLNQ